jgi:hypothetical protein
MEKAQHKNKKRPEVSVAESKGLCVALQEPPTMDIVSALTGTTAQVVYFLFCVVAAIATIRRSVVEGKKKATVNRTITKQGSRPSCES